MSDLLDEAVALLHELVKQSTTEPDPSKRREITSEIWRVIEVVQRLRGEESDLRSPELP